MDWVNEDADGIDAIGFSGGDWDGRLLLGYGANLIRLRHRGVDLLRTPSSTDEMTALPEAWGIPVLFPPNRIAGGRFSFEGREYVFPINDSFKRFHIHGMLVRRPWMVESTQENGITLRFDHTPQRESFAWYTHEFTAWLSYEFDGDRIRQTIRFRNESTGTMPFAFGFHTAFRTAFPVKESDAPDEEHTRVRVTTASSQWEMKGQAVTGEQVPFAAGQDWASGFCPKGMSLATHTPVVPDDNGFRGAVIENPAAGIRIVYEIDPQFTQWMLWNYLGDKGFFCPEPQTWVIDALNSNLPPEVSGARGLKPQQEWFAQNTITVDNAN